MSKNPLSQPIRGARDFYPAELALRNWLFNNWRATAQGFGYEEVDGPNLESFDLFAAKSGEELVNQQMYTLEDKDGRPLGVRPEITPTFARLVAKRQNELSFPLRWMMFGEVWRYEKPQTGRSRDFWQWELNLVGGDEDLADAEVITIAAKALQSLGLTSDDVVLRLNDRRFMQDSLRSLGIEEDKYLKVIKVIDRREKISTQEFTTSLLALDLSEKQITNLTQFLDTKDYTHSPKLTRLFQLLSDYGVADFVQFDPLIVRGITYYTGTVFECFDKGKTLRSIFGGGRFDDLIETFGGGKLPAVGFAIGDVVVSELLKRLDRLPSLKPVPTQVLVTIFNAQLADNSLKIANFLRENGIPTELYPALAKLDKQLKYADRKNIPYAVIIGEEEAIAKQLVLKNLTTKQQEVITPEKLLALLSPPKR